MNRATRRSILRVAAGYDECEGLIDLDFSAREEIPRNLLRAWSGAEISIQCYACARGSSAEYRLSVRRHDGRQLREHWKTLQRVKEFVFPDRVGFESYPRKDHVIDEAPMWHICPECGNGHFPRNYEYILRRAVSEWGTESQLRQLQEECCELATAVSHLARGREGAEAELIAEVADVEIMIEQARLMLGDAEIDRAKRSKIFRLAQKLNIDLTLLGGV